MSPIYIYGYVQHDAEANDYTYWCIDCVPDKLREPHREVDRDEAESSGAECDGCGWVLADGPVP